MTDQQRNLLNSLWRYCQKIGIAAYKVWEQDNKELLLRTFGFIPDVEHQAY